jgi:hypothetical protein
MRALLPLLLPVLGSLYGAKIEGIATKRKAHYASLIRPACSRLERHAFGVDGKVLTELVDDGKTDTSEIHRIRTALAVPIVVDPDIPNWE